MFFHGKVGWNGSQYRNICGMEVLELWHIAGLKWRINHPWLGMVTIPPNKNGDDWRMVYHCFTYITNTKPKRIGDGLQPHFCSYLGTSTVIMENLHDATVFFYHQIEETNGVLMVTNGDPIFYHWWKPIQRVVLFSMLFSINLSPSLHTYVGARPIWRDQCFLADQITREARRSTRPCYGLRFSMTL